MKPTRQNPFLRNLLTAASIGFCLVQTAQSALIYWDTNGTTAGSGAATGTWGTSTFWTASEPGTTATNGALPTANDDVFIAAGTTGTAGTITINGAQVAGSVTIQEPAANPGVTISGGTSLTLGGGSSVSKGLFVTGNGAHTVSTPLILSGANTIQNAGNLTLTVSGGITGTGDLTLRNNSTGATGIQLLATQLNPAGGISNAGSGSGGAVIGNANSTTGTGGLGANVTSVSQDSATSSLQFLNADNSAYTGSYDINAGTLNWAGTNTGPGSGTNLGSITATNAASVINLGATSGTAAATLNIVNNAVSGKLNNNIRVRAGSSGTKTIGVAIGGNGVTFSTTGTITLDDNVTLQPSSGAPNLVTLNPNGLISDGVNGPKGITKAGGGNVNFSLAHPYSGTTSVTAGVLALTGANGSLPSTSGITISGGTLQLNNTGAANNGDRIPNSTVVTMTGGTLDFRNDAAAGISYSETIALTANAGGTITANQAAADGTSTLTIGSFTRGAGGTLSFTGTGLGVDSRNRIFFATSPAVNGVIPWATTNATTYAAYDATNGVTTATTSDINALGATIANDPASNLRITADGSGGNIALGATTTAINTLVQANTTLATPPTIDTAAKTLALNSVLVSSAANTRGLTIGAAPNDGMLTPATAGGELFLINNSTANPITVNAGISDNTSASSVSKIGGGNVTFAGTGAYTGGTQITGGIVTATNASAFGSGPVTLNPTTTRLVINDGLNLANNITFRGGGASSRGVFENTGTGEATLSGTITIDGPLAGGGHFASVSTGSLRVTGPINSAVQPVSARLGTVIFSGGGSYSSFILNQGTLRLGADNGLSTSATADIAASAAGSLDLNGFNQTLVGITRSAGNAATIGNGSNLADSVLTTTGTSTYAGNITNVIGTPATPKTTSLVVSSGNLTLSGGFTAQNATINNGGTLTIAGSAGDGIAPVSRLISVNSGGTLRYTSDNRINNDTIIDLPAGAILDMNGRVDVVGHIRGAGSVTNLNNSLTLALPAVGSPAEFSGTLSGTSTVASSLVLRSDGTGASAASSLTLSGDNSGMIATGVHSSVNVQGGRLIGRHTAAFGPAGQIVTVGAAALTLDPTVEFGTDTPMNSYILNISSGNTGTIELNRATPGAALTQAAGASTIGNGTLNIEKGANVTTGTPVLQFSSLVLSAGGPGLGAAALNPVDVDVVVLGGVTRPGGAAANLRLAGTSTGNSIAGAIQNNGANLLSVIKSGTSTWTLGGLNSYTGTTTISGGSLHLTGSLAAGSAVTVGGATATGTPTLTGAGGTVNGTLNIAAAGGGAAGTVNPGTAGTTGILNAGATTISGTFACDVNGANTDLLAVTGDLTLGGTLAVNEVAAGTPGTYVIATYTGTRSGTLGGTLPAGYSVNYDDANKEVELVIAPASGFASWITGTFANGTVPGGQQGENDDPDGDGANNLVEFAFDGDPTTGANNGKIHAFTVDTDHDGETANAELVLTVAVRSAVGAFTGPTSKSASGDGITYTIEGSTTLNPFTTQVNNVPTAVPPSPATLSPGYVWKSFSLDGSNGLPGKGFLRAKVTAP